MDFWIKGISSILEENKKTGWIVYKLFNGFSRLMKNLSCHVGVLSEGKMPHPLHQHAEEEVMVILCGELECTTAQDRLPYGKKQDRLKRGSVIYLSAYHQHTIRSIGPGPAEFLIIRWKGTINKLNADIPKSFVFNQSERDQLPISKFGSELSMVRLFEMPTKYLRNLCASIQDLKIDAGVKPHRSDHDLAIILMDGRIDTMHSEISAPAVLFFPAGIPHWTKNVGQIATSSFVFEFHGDKGVSLQR